MAIIIHIYDLHILYYALYVIIYISVIFSRLCSDNRNWSSLWGQMPEGRTESILKSYSCSSFPIYILSVTPLDLRKCQIDKQMTIAPHDRPSLSVISYLSSQPSLFLLPLACLTSSLLCSIPLWLCLESFPRLPPLILKDFQMFFFLYILIHWILHAAMLLPF